MACRAVLSRFPALQPKAGFRSLASTLAVRSGLYASRHGAASITGVAKLSSYLPKAPLVPAAIPACPSKQPDEGCWAAPAAPDPAPARSAARLRQDTILRAILAIPQQQSHDDCKVHPVTLSEAKSPFPAPRILPLRQAQGQNDRHSRQPFFNRPARIPRAFRLLSEL